MPRPMDDLLANMKLAYVKAAFLVLFVVVLFSRRTR